MIKNNRRSFPDNYRALVAAFLLLFISVTASAQYDSTKVLQDQNAYGFNWKNGAFRGSLRIPTGDTITLAVADSGSVRYYNGGQFYWNGYYWVASSGTGSTVVSDSAWSLTGNSGTTAGTNFIGTTDSVDFVIKSVNNPIASFSGDGSYSINFGNVFTNTVSGFNSTVSGGNTNIASGYLSSIGGGFANIASEEYSTVSGGNSNLAINKFSNIAGGASNTTSGYYSSILGGKGNYSKSFGGAVVGIFNDSTSATDGGAYNLTNRAFQVGIGSSSIARSNAMTVLFNGKVSLEKYGIGSFTGTPAKTLNVNSVGDIIETDPIDTLSLSSRINSKVDTIQIYGDVINTTFPGTSAPSGTSTTYSINNGVTVTGGATNYYTNYFIVSNPSAALNYKITGTFTLTTKPTGTGEGIWFGKLSTNTTGRVAVSARAEYVDANNWTIKLYSITGFSTETLVSSTPIYTPASIEMTNGANYRIEISFNSPNIQIDFSRIDTTLVPYQDVIESISIPYTYTTVIGNNVQIANSGQYGFGAIGSTPAGVYEVNEFYVAINSRKNVDFAIVGNSIASGYNSSSPENTWTNRLFANTGKTYSIFAGSGDKTADVLTRLTEIWVTNPKYLLLEIGWNDIGHSVGSAVFSANLNAIIDSVKAHGITPIVLRLPQTAFGYDTAFVNVCYRQNVKLINPGSTLIGTLDAFGIHTNDKGNLIIANLVRLRCPEIFGAPNPLLLSQSENMLSRTVSSNESADIYTNKYYIDATSGNVQLNLYATDVSTVGKVITVVRLDGTANTVTIDAAGSNTINGAGSVTIGSQYETLVISGISSTAWVSSEISVSGGASVITPSVIGGTGATSSLTLQSSSGTATTGSDIIFKDNNTEWMRIINDGRVGIGTATPGTLNGTSFSSLGLLVKNASGSGYIASDANGPSGFLLNDNSQSANSRLWGFTNQSARLAFTRYTDAGSPTEILSVLRTGEVGILTTTPHSNLTIAGSFATAYRAITALRTLDGTDHTINCTANTFTVTLPTAVGITGREYTITNSGAGVITIATTSSQTFTNINATPTTLTLDAVAASAVTSYTVKSTGAAWIVTAKVLNP